METKTEKISWIDSAKGFAMIFIMLSHTSFPYSRIFFVFHVQMFFFLSGYLFNTEKYNDVRIMLRSRIPRLMIPYFSLSTLNCLIYTFVLYLKNRNAWESIEQGGLHIIGALTAVRQCNWNTHMGTFWFIPCLLFTEILYCTIHILLKKVWMQVCAVCGVSTLGFYYTVTFAHPLPWSVDAACIALLFFAYGNYVHKYAPRILFSSLWCLLPLSIFVYTANTQKCDMYTNTYGNVPLYVIGSCAGILFFLMLVCRLPQIKPIQYVGNNSVYFLCLHQYPVYGILEFVHYKSFYPFYVHVPQKAGWKISLVDSLMIVSVASVLIFCITEILRRLAPRIFGMSAAKQMRSTLLHL